MWICRCQCGKETCVRAGHLKTGNVQSCGCLNRQRSSERMKKYREQYQEGCGPNYKHGDSFTRLYQTWAAMKARCSNWHHHAYRYYGQRGIIVCPEWQEDYVAFKRWALPNGYNDGLTIDRIDNDGNYEPKNCHWISLSENTARAHKGRRGKRYKCRIKNPVRRISLNAKGIYPAGAERRIDYGRSSGI